MDVSHVILLCFGMESKLNFVIALVILFQKKTIGSLKTGSKNLIYNVVILIPKH